MNPFLRLLGEAPVVAILRRPRLDLSRCVDLLVESGIALIEITMDSDQAVPFLSSVRHRQSDRTLFGAGTVTSIELLEAAVQAGARFFVTPNFNPAVISAARERQIPICAGALTPTEICAAHEAGAEVIKVFPAGTMGSRYFRELRGPFPHLRLMATGGIGLENAAEYFAAGVSAIGVGSALIPKEDHPKAFKVCAETARALLAARFQHD
ncbi:MAG: bifunctional 4-hydroxy-2-oxoglutarate aldolase/2-dehydro-3-deoxy-phosphogluconate aldolase [Chthoniobacterales bacterium]